MIMLRSDPIDIIRITAADVHPPLYYFIAKLFTIILGRSVTSVKIASITPLILTLVFILHKCKQLFPKNYKIISIIAILLTGLSPIAFSLSVELRMYTWAMFFVTCSGIYAYQVYQTSINKKYITFFILSALGAAYTHYYAALSVCFIYLILFTFLITNNRKNWKLCLIISCITIVGYLPWLPTFIKQFTTTSSSWWLATFNNDTIISYITFLFNGDFSKFFLITISIIVVSSLALCYKSKDKDLKFALCAISIILLTVLAGCIASKLIRPLFLARYMYPASGLFFFGISICVPKIRYKQLAYYTIVALVIINIPYSYNQAYKDEYKTGTESFKQFANEKLKNEEISTDITHLSWTILPYYLPNKQIHSTITKDTRGYIITAKKQPDLEKIIPNTDIKQVYSGNIDNKYSFVIYYAQNRQ